MLDKSPETKINWFGDKRFFCPPEGHLPQICLELEVMISSHQNDTYQVMIHTTTKLFTNRPYILSSSEEKGLWGLKG